MLRHVVLFTWSDAADDERRATTLAALRRLPEEVGGMTSFAVGPDAGLREGNAHTALVADFPDVEAWRRYADHPVHLQIIEEHVRPWLAARSAVQYEV
ncbi:MAG TPA: Dabb family protein [Geodermatophilus sp.]|nr:Dabb family protein [Geodermatophilus sp.]